MILSLWAPLRHQIYVLTLTGDPTLTNMHFYLSPAPLASQTVGLQAGELRKTNSSLLWVLRKIWDGIRFVGISRYQIA